MRYSDAANLKQSDIKEEHIEVNILKTTDRLNIDLNSHSKAILEKYKDIHLYENKVFSIISNQKMNDQLKELAEMAGIDETARQTYYIGKKRFDEITSEIFRSKQSCRTKNIYLQRSRSWYLSTSDNEMDRAFRL